MCWGEERDLTSDICLLQDFPRSGSGWSGAERPVPRRRACRIARLLTQYSFLLEELFWLVADDRGMGKFGALQLFPLLEIWGQWFARAAALFKHRELEFLSHQHIFSADSAWATHKHMANPDSSPVSGRVRANPDTTAETRAQVWTAIWPNQMVRGRQNPE